MSPPFLLGSFSLNREAPFLGVLVDDAVTPVAELDSSAFNSTCTLLTLLEDWNVNLAALKTGVGNRMTAQHRIPLAELRVCAPLPDARQVFCTGANYRSHVVEMIVAIGAGSATDKMDADQRRAFGEAYVDRQIAESAPYVFLKNVTAIAGPYDELVLPAFSDKIDWEIELGAVIGISTYRVPREKALESVAGFMIVNDLTARDKVIRTDPGAIGPDWIASKGVPGFLPTGPYFAPAEFISNPQDLAMRLAVNGIEMQSARTSEMTFDIARQIEFLASYTRMLPGDIICTGTPAGSGLARGVFLAEGDVVEAQIEGLGRQIVRCARGA